MTLEASDSSRATSLDGLQVLNFNPTKVLAHPKVRLTQLKCAPLVLITALSPSGHNLDEDIDDTAGISATKDPCIARCDVCSSLLFLVPTLSNSHAWTLYDDTNVVMHANIVLEEPDECVGKCLRALYENAFKSAIISNHNTQIVCSLLHAAINMFSRERYNIQKRQPLRMTD